MIWNQGGSQMLSYYYIFDICIGQFDENEQKICELGSMICFYTVNCFCIFTSFLY